MLEEKINMKILIRSCYSWYNVFVNNTLVLMHLGQKDIEDILDALHKTNTPYDMDLRN